jgi:transcriptional regulator with XRE-family HTH domain
VAALAPTTLRDTAAVPYPARPTLHAVVPLPDLLRAYRAAHGASRRDAAALLGLSESAWAGWETGRVPTPQNLDPLAALLGLTPDEARASAGPDRIRRSQPAVPDLATLPGLRAAAGLSASELARRVHVSLSLVSRWESGERTPCRAYWPALSEALGVSEIVLADLYAGRLAARDLTDVPSLRRLRGRARLSQPALAAGLGIDVSTYQRWERRGRVPATRYADLAALLGVDPAELRRPVVAVPRPAPTVSALRRIRRRRYLSARCVAERAGCSQAALWSWERGTTRPTWAQARRLAAALGAPVGEVFAAAGLDSPEHLDRATWRRGDLPVVLRELRVWSGLTQRELGAAVGVTSLTVSAWEQGRRRPRRGSLVRLQRVLPGVPVSTLPH